MPFSIPEILFIIIFLVIALLAMQIGYKNWSHSTKIILLTGSLLVANEVIEHYIGELASIVFISVVALLLLIVGAVRYFKKPI